MARPFTRVALGALLAATAGCSGGGGGSGTSVTPTPTATPTPIPTVTATGGPVPTGSPTQGPTNFNVLPCLQQTIPGYNITVAQMLGPDTIKVYPAQPIGYPNGRRPGDAVVDITLAMAFVDLTQRPLGILSAVPINPGGNDVPYRTDFPYFGLPHGNAADQTDKSGTSFAFRTDGDDRYVRVDRMGLAAIATVLIGSPLKNEYNDATPADDLRLRFTPDEIEQLRRLTVGLADDLLMRGVPLCARPL